MLEGPSFEKFECPLCGKSALSLSFNGFHCTSCGFRPGQFVDEWPYEGLTDPHMD